MSGTTGAPKSNIAAEAWEYYARTMLAAHLGESERALAKQSFMVGALSCVGIMRTVIEGARQGKALETIGVALEVLQAELDGYLPGEPMRTS